jgi:hypothetical protein
MARLLKKQVKLALVQLASGKFSKLIPLFSEAYQLTEI